MSLIARHLTARTDYVERHREDLMRMTESFEGVIQLSRGDPDIPPPPHVIMAARHALEEGRIRYTSWQGIHELRRAISLKLQKDNNLHYEPDEVVVTTGSQEALYLAMMALVAPGDEVLLADPHYSSFSRMVNIAGGTFVPIPTYEEDRFAIRPEEVRRRLTSKSKVMLVATPVNPTGTVLSRETLEKLAAIAQEADLLVISDEIYEKITYNNARHVSIASLPGMRERSIVINGFSKAYSMTGFRVGYLAGPLDMIQRLEILKASLTLCTPTISQWAGVAALEGPQDHISEKMHAYEQRRTTVMRALDGAHISYAPPDGTMYLFANIGQTGMTSFEFCQRLLTEARVQVSPGSSYGGGEGYIRISWVVPTDRVREAMERIVDFFRGIVG